jgi:hypothetical protein
MRLPFTAALAITLGLSAAPAAQAGPDPYRFLNNSYWYVPTETLPAIQVDPSTGAVTRLVDQTLWTITSYTAGYFLGTSTAVLKNADTGAPIGPPSCTRIVGSVTPKGDVYIAFLDPSDPNAAADAIVGLGHLEQQAGTTWRFTMQMSTGNSSAIAHWSYMNQCKAGAPCNTRLPGTTLSLQQFAALCN